MRPLNIKAEDELYEANRIYCALVSRSRATDFHTLQGMFVPGSIAWSERQIERLENEQ